MPVLLYGAGQGGVAARRELQRNAAWGMRPIGFIDDKKDLRGKTVGGLPVFGGLDSLESTLEETKAQAVALTSRKIPEERVERIHNVLAAKSVAFYRFDIRFREETQDKKNGEVALKPQPR